MFFPLPAFFSLLGLGEDSYAVPVRRSAYFGSNFPIEEEARYLGSTTPSRMPGLAAHGQTRPQPCASHLVNSANS